MKLLETLWVKWGNTFKKLNKKIIEHVSRKKDEGGLELIDLAERIKTLKIQAILNAGDQSPESDNIIYEVGTQQITIYDRTFTGARIEIPKAKTNEYIKLIKKSKEKLTNYKRRKKITKDIQDIIFPKQKTHIQKLKKK